MKTKIALITIALMTFAASAQPWLVDTLTKRTNTTSSTAYLTFTCTTSNLLIGINTNSGNATNFFLAISNALYTAVNTNSISFGDTLSNSFIKVNSNALWFQSEILSNTTAISGLGQTNGWLWQSNATVYPIAIHAITNYSSGVWLTNGIFTNSVFSGIFIGTNFSLAFADRTDSFGTSGQVPKADGSGSWLWTDADVIPDTGGMGGTTVHIKASDTGGDMYIHVDSSGVITATGSP